MKRRRLSEAVADDKWLVFKDKTSMSALVMMHTSRRKADGY